MERTELKGKIKTLTQGQVSDAVVDKMASTFLALVKLADFNAPRGAAADGDSGGDSGGGNGGPEGSDANGGGGGDGGRRFIPDGAGGALGTGDALRLGGFVYNIELHLPESRDPAIYEALFRALKAHLLS